PVARPIGLRIVNTGDRIYLKVDSPNVTVLTDSDEVKLREGKFEDKAADESIRGVREFVDLEPLPEAKKSEYGKLYRLSGSVRRRIASFGTAKKKKGKIFLRFCMGMLAAVAVLLTAIYGKKLSVISEASGSFNDRMFYVGEKVGSAGEKLQSAVNDLSSGIDFFSYAFRPYYSLVEGDDVEAVPDYFVTDSSPVRLMSNAVTLPFGTAEKTPVAAGEKLDGDGYEWITRAVADDLLKDSRVGYIRTYRDLIGLVNRFDGRKISAVLDTDERALYLSENYIMEQNALRLGLKVRAGDAEDGTTILNKIGNDSDQYYNTSGISVGSKVKISGRDFTVTEIRTLYETYREYLLGEHKDVYDLVSGALALGDAAEFYKKLASDRAMADSLGIKTDGAGFEKLSETYPFAVFDYAYRFFDDWVAYCVENGIRNPDYVSGSADAVYRKLGYDAAKYVAYGDGQSVRDYYFLMIYRSVYGTDPGKDLFVPAYSESGYSASYELRKDEFYLSLGSWAAFDALSEDVNNYANFTPGISFGSMNDVFFTLSENDLSYVCRVKGETSEAVDGGNWKFSADETAGWYYEPIYYAVHASDVRAAEKYLASAFPDEFGKEGQAADNVVSPGMTLRYVKLANNLDVAGGVVPFAVILVLLALCVYFIIRSDLMNRVREVGIYRAIGVSKRNLRFEFMTGASLLALTSVVPGFLLSSAALFYVMGRTAYALRALYYPVWLAALLLAFLTAVCLISGLLPINRLLRKTPAEILSKYDI
ncbi:MAG: ABC transporter permease, partial [Clostridia bacterium]|nr:ABC transporter permease [Clostridia bacterium]